MLCTTVRNLLSYTSVNNLTLFTFVAIVLISITGRTALHIAILKESIEIVEMFVKLAPEALKIGDNVREINTIHIHNVK